jgi:hypothetical protein
MPRSANPALEALWRRRLRQQPDSGLTVDQFCEREGVSLSGFYAWKRRLAVAAASPVKASPCQSPFVPVTVQPALKPQSHDFVEPVTIQLANGGRILLPITAGVELICQVVETVARATAIVEDTSC